MNKRFSDQYLRNSIVTSLWCRIWKLCALALVSVCFNVNTFAQETKSKNTTSIAALEEIIVTARRRAENLQQTPVAVSALGEQALIDAGIRTITDLQDSVPGLQFGESGSKTPAIFIRGIGQREGTAVLDPGVGVYLNEIFIARQDGQLLDTVDTESIQVLRGPQGTLFGKNNTGGALLVTTKKPHFEDYEFALGSTVGEHGRKDFKLSGNIPLVEDRLGMRFALFSKKRDGFLENMTDGSAFGDEDRLALTNRVLWDVTDSFSADLFFYWSKRRERSTALTCVLQNDQANVGQLAYPGFSNGFAEACNESQRAADDSKVSINSEDSVAQMTSAISALTLNWSFENLDIKSITGYSTQYDILRNDDQDGTAIQIISNGGAALKRTLEADGRNPLDEQRFQISQELQISGTLLNEKLSYTTGIFYSLEEIDDNAFFQLIGPNGLSGIRAGTICAGAAGDLAVACAAADAAATTSGEDIVFPLATLLGGSTRLRNESWAIFAQATYEMNEWLQITLGGRHTVETREREFDRYSIDHSIYEGRLRAATGNPSTTFLGSDVGFYSPILASELHSAAGRLPVIPLSIEKSADIRQEKWRRFTPTFTVSSLATPDLLEYLNLDSGMAYFTWSKGFKAGGFEPKGSELVTFNPEDVENVELGLKIDALGSRLRVNAAAYLMDYTNIHVRVAEQGPAISDVYLFISNAGEAQVSGIEIETTFLLGSWQFFSAANYTDAVYDRFDGQVVVPGSGTEHTVDRSSDDFVLVSRKSASAGFQYNGVTKFGAVIPRLSMYYRSGIFIGIDDQAAKYDSSYIDSQIVWNGRVSWIPDEHFRLSIYSKNLTDEQYFTSGLAVSALVGAATQVQGERRNVGVEFSYEF